MGNPSSAVPAPDHWDRASQDRIPRPSLQILECQRVDSVCFLFVLSALTLYNLRQEAELAISSDKIADMRLKQMEMLQGVITRLSNQGATLKNYCTTITMAAGGFAVTAQRPIVVMLAFVAIVSFAFLDARYLFAERRFRALFARARSEDWEALPTFDFDQSSVKSTSYWSCYTSWSVLGFYVPLALGSAALMTILWVTYGRFF
jgi:hypothetical protein